MVRLSAYLVIIIGLFIPLSLKADADLQPHRAYYTLSMMGRPDPQSHVSDVRGTMMVEFNKACDGWTVQHLSEIWRYQDDGSVEHLRWVYATWESDDGSVFKFNILRKTNDKIVEDIRGLAKRRGKLIDVSYKNPKEKMLHLTEGILFPIQHLKEVLKAAEAGEHMFPSILFDGSNSDGPSEINTFMGTKKVLTGNTTSEDAHQFANQPYWPIHFTVYGLGETAYEPLYATTEKRLSNGIIKQIIIDNEGVKIKCELERIKILNGSDS